MIARGGTEARQGQIGSKQIVDVQRGTVRTEA